MEEIPQQPNPSRALIVTIEFKEKSGMMAANPNPMVVDESTS